MTLGSNQKRTNRATDAFPLQWPSGRPRTPAAKRQRSQFHRITREPNSYNPSHMMQRKREMTMAEGISRVMAEFSKFTRNGHNWRVNPDLVVISSNVQLRQDGLPYSNRREPDDPGVAVYFELDGKAHCLSCDKWDKVADNLAAIAAHVEAVRGQERWGVADLAQMFAGFKQLPGGAAVAPAMTVEDAAAFVVQHMGPLPAAQGLEMSRVGVQLVMNDASLCREAYRHAAKRLHPDAGGTVEQFQRLQEAKRVLDLHHG